ncbi:hypothetical protein BGW38_004143 [Lunasporangiospora selenospora]|uniref:NADH:flavin oxidoreductase/NADH oxidase N-terminal domain-containing protein n=1 Tax=Lunasporangiospora selenospora TaxID=979761 RepID=A0A9P6G0L2_9FUNG|nr:hypothetical protein BGW38_004143 [Lunasporangiospora selenospora]
MPSTNIAATSAQTKDNGLGAFVSGTKHPQERYFIDQPAAPGSYLGPIDPTKPNAEEIPLLFQSVTIKDLTLPNRVVVAPMCMFSSLDGFFTDFHLVHLGSFAVSGAGLIIAEATAVVPEGRISPSDTGLWSDEHIPGLKRIVDFAHAQGSKIGIQLAHAGRKASVKPYFATHPESSFWKDNVVGPSGGPEFQWDENHHVPRELSIEEIQETIKAFGVAAARAAKAGMDTVEIHGAHGYLIHNFLSPVSNQRKDRYGGSLENRARFLLEVIRSVRENFPAEKPIFLRVSATDFIEHLPDQPSWEIEQTVQLAQWVKEAGVDVFHVSAGGNTALQQVSYQPGYQVPFAERVKKAVPGLHVVAVGVITNGKQAEEVLQQEKADLIAVGRAFLRHPNFVLNAAQELNVKAAFSAQYGRGRI